MTDTTINGLSTALAATAAADDQLVIWDTSASATKKHAAAYLARSDGASGNLLITGSGRELTVPATGTAALLGAANTFTDNIKISKAGSGTVGPTITLNHTSGATGDEARVIFQDSGTDRIAISFGVVAGGDANFNVLDLFGTPKQLLSLSPDGDLWIYNNVSAASFTDRTPAFNGDALAAVAGIGGSNGEIDHSTLPAFARATGANGEELRDIGGMLSVLTVAVQQLLARVEALEAQA